MWLSIAYSVAAGIFLLWMLHRYTKDDAARAEAQQLIAEKNWERLEAKREASERFQNEREMTAYHEKQVLLGRIEDLEQWRRECETTIQPTTLRH